MQAVASAVRASWATVGNWQYWVNFTKDFSYAAPDLPMDALGHMAYLSPSFWDALPFAFDLFNASKGFSFINVSQHIAGPKSVFLS